MAKFRVNVDKGWPLGAALYKHGEVFEIDETDAITAAVASGYIEPVYETAMGKLTKPQMESLVSEAQELIEAARNQNDPED